MPGIVGIISDRNEQGLFNVMQQTLNHHAYSIDSDIQNGVHLGRIHLNFLNAEKQPLHSSDGNLSLLFYGEIFSIEGEIEFHEGNSARLLLDQVEKNGFKVFEKINGQFCACIFDHVTRATYLISDRFGTYPVYYAFSNNRLLFASEVKAILKDNRHNKLNLHGIAELFSIGLLFGNKTLFENIQLVPAATILKFENNTVQSTQYWTYPYSESIYVNGRPRKSVTAQFEEELAEVMTRAAKRQSAHSDKMFFSLSGGIDSRYVAALYHHIGVRNLPAFTMGSDENEDQKYASMVARVLDLPHYKFDIKPERIWKDAARFSYVSDGMSLISGPLQNFEPLEYFTDSKKIVTYSQMCDALFGSTLSRAKVNIHKNNTQPRAAINEALINQFKRFDDNLIKALFHPEVYNTIRDLYRIEPEKYCRNEYHPLHNYFLQFMNEYVRRGVLGGNLVINLFYQTRMISFDNEVFNFGWQLPVPYREYQYLYRKTFGKLFPELAKIKRQGYNLKIDASNLSYKFKTLEKKIATVAKKSPLNFIAKHYKPWNTPEYVNYDLWFREQLRENLQTFLMERKISSGELLNQDVVKQLVKKHIEGREDNSAILWQIINLEYFYLNFVH